MQRSIENLVHAFQSTIKIEGEPATHFQSKRAQGESSTSRGCGRGRRRGNNQGRGRSSKDLRSI